MSEPQHHRGSSKQDYQTPVALLNAARRRLCIQDFSIDLAATEDNKVTELFYSEAQDSLKQQWNHPGIQWCNPPFAWIEPWVIKARIQTTVHRTWVAMLLPAAVGSNWWRDWVHQKCAVLFLNGRVTFVGQTQSYPKDCCLLIYGPENNISIGYEVWTWRES